MREAAAGSVVVGPGEGNTFSGRGGGYTLVTKATDEETRGAYAFQEMTVAPGFPWIPPHVHRNGDEAMYVLQEREPRVPPSGHGRGAGGRGVEADFYSPRAYGGWE